MYNPVSRSNGAGVARVQRQAQILTCLYDQANPEENAAPRHAGTKREGWLTTVEVARCCGLSASPHLRTLLYDLSQAGAVYGEAEQYRSNMQVYWWHIHPDTRYSKEWIGVFDAYLGEGRMYKLIENPVNSEEYTRIVNDAENERMENLR